MNGRARVLQSLKRITVSAYVFNKYEQIQTILVYIIIVYIEFEKKKIKRSRREV